MTSEEQAQTALMLALALAPIYDDFHEAALLGAHEFETLYNDEEVTREDLIGVVREQATLCARLGNALTAVRIASGEVRPLEGAERINHVRGMIRVVWGVHPDEA